MTFAPRFVITELAYNPAGRDQEFEWLEIQNQGTATAVVPDTSAGKWRIRVGQQSHPLTFLQGAKQIAPGERFLIVQNIDQTPAPIRASPTPIFRARFTLPNRSQQLALSLDNGTSWSAELTYDPAAGGNGDGRTLEQTVAGVWQASQVIDGTPSRPPHEGTPPPPAQAIISEFLAWPEPNLTEWIELSNPHSEPLDLVGWSIDDGPRGSKAYTFAADRTEGTMIPAGGYLVISQTESRLSLQTTDAVRLMNPSGQAVQTIPYTTPERGRSWVEQQGTSGCWSQMPTPGARNICANAFHPQAIQIDAPPIAAQQPPKTAPRKKSATPPTKTRVPPATSSSRERGTRASLPPDRPVVKPRVVPLVAAEFSSSQVAWMTAPPIPTWTLGIVLGMIGGLLGAVGLLGTPGKNDEGIA